jgi:probable rRNA maturation factor
MSDPSPPQTSVRNIQRKIRINVGELETFAALAVQCCLQLRKQKRTDLRSLPEVFVWLISDRRMALLHRQFLGKTGPTDVLTFQHGEIFISVETAQRHARVFGEEDARRGRRVHGGGNSLTRELELYIVHGLLHLHGFEDRTQTEARKMKAAQERILRCALECLAKRLPGPSFIRGRKISDFLPLDPGRNSRDPSLCSG